MLTPRFSLEQDEKFLTVTIYAPFTHIDQTEIFMDGTDFRFSSPPYFLRLHLPGEVEETDAASGAWDAETTSFVVRCPKVTEGEHFEGLQMLTDLLTPKGGTSVRKGVEELIGGDEEEVEEEDEEEIEWYFEQKLEDPASDQLTHDPSSHGYGFGFKHTAAYSQLLAEFGEILDLSDPDSMNHKEREAARLEKEDKEFDSDHYLADLMNADCVLEECLAWAPPELRQAFSPAEQEQLLALPKIRHQVARPDLASVHLALADILFGHCFALRASQGEVTTEHGWLTAKLSASLSACARFSSASGLVRSGARRALTYPYYRSWQLALAAWRDVVRLLAAGKAPIIQALLGLNLALGEAPGYYIFSQLYVSDYCVWLQTVPAPHLASLAGVLARAVERLGKEDLGLELVELEEAARLTLLEEEEGPVGELAQRMGSIRVAKESTKDAAALDSDDDASSEDSSSDDTSDEES
jgi:protein SHQ1